MTTLELTSGELAQAAAALAELMRERRPVRLGLALRRVARQIDPAVQDAAALEREIVERYARRDETGAPVPGRGADGREEPGTVLLTDAEGCQRELMALRQARVRVQVDPLRPEEFAEPGPDVEPWVLLALGALLDDATGPW